MAKSFKLSIVSPDKVVADERVVSFIAPAVEGYLGVMANHEPFVAELKPGEVVYRRENGSEQLLALSGGFMEVSENKAIILADAAEKPSEIDVERARQAAQRARDLLASHDEAIDRDHVRDSLMRAMNRLRIVDKEL